MLAVPGQSFYISFDENIRIKCKLGFLAKDFIYSEITSFYIFTVKIFVVLEMIVSIDESSI